MFRLNEFLKGKLSGKYKIKVKGFKLTNETLEFTDVTFVRKIQSETPLLKKHKNIYSSQEESDIDEPAIKKQKFTSETSSTVEDIRIFYPQAPEFIEEEVSGDYYFWY